MCDGIMGRKGTKKGEEMLEKEFLVKKKKNVGKRVTVR
jgi:hypothetical protein